MRRNAEGMMGRHWLPSRHCERSEAIQRFEAAPRLPRRDAPRNDARIFGAVFFAASLLFAAPALAASRSIDDCEAIKEADAYNRCLASFGPTRGQHGATYPGVAAEGGHSGKASGRSASRPPSRTGGARLSASRGGRMRMEFTPGRW
ncbi:hypothetical protein EHO51_02315 [Methylocystis rosea]|uniref:Uncharacterized protein n=1 Tax=Methylocystis rosea TaxID=173366 RepID=A0A3G8M1V7_9HYPH|nr:hypothetical protein EHO51_02315 [Methylocystis rosea]